jgi:hypothetical protein
VNIVLFSHLSLTSHTLTVLIVVLLRAVDNPVHSDDDLRVRLQELLIGSAWDSGWDRVRVSIHGSCMLSAGRGLVALL